jgi:Fe-coproporphyrin III synthase
MTFPAMRRAVRFGSKLFAANFGRAVAPWKLSFALTYRCNHRCANCAIWQKKPLPQDELSAGEIRRFFETSGGSVSWLDLTGGEIFSRADLDEILDAVLTNCPSLYVLHFPTNGMFAKPAARFAERVAQSRGPKLIVSVSLDGPSDVHNRLRGVADAWNRALDTYRTLTTMGVETYFGMTLSRENAGLVPDTLRELRADFPALPDRDLHVNVLHRSDHYYGNMSLPPVDGPSVASAVEDLLRLRGKARGFKDWLESAYLRGVSSYLASGKSPLPCRSLSDSCFINPQGIVFPCSIWDRPLGSLRDFDFQLGRLLDQSRVAAAREEIGREACPGCWTPCDAYPTILGNAAKAVALRNGSGAFRAEERKRKSPPWDDVAIVIPAKDESGTVGGVVEASKRFTEHVWVIEGNSTDRTAETAFRAGARVLKDGRRGKGAALRQAAREINKEILVFIDADGSHIAGDIPKLVEPLFNDEADMVIASRVRGGSDEAYGNWEFFIRTLGGHVITFLINLRWGVFLTDSQNGFRAVKRRAMLDLGLTEDKTTIEQEMVMKGLKKGLRIVEIGSHEKARLYGESKIVLWRDWLAYGWSLIKGLLL